MDFNDVVSFFQSATPELNDSYCFVISVKMLSYLYENSFSSQEIWNIIEDCFLWQIPATVKRACLNENPKMRFD